MSGGFRTTIRSCQQARRDVRVLVAVAFVLHAAAAHAQQSRRNEVANARAEKAQTLRPSSPRRLEAVLLALEDRRLVERVFDPPRGLFARVGGLTEGAGFAAGPAYRIGAPGLSVTASAALSIKRYSKAEATFRASELAAGRLFAEAAVGRFEFPQEIFFGPGGRSLELMRSNFALRATRAQGAAGVRIASWLTAGGEVEYLSPRIGRGTDRRFPSTDVIFTDADAPGLDVQPDFVRVEAFALLDHTDLPDNPTSGGRYELSYARYADRGLDRYSFGRWDVDIRRYVPLLLGSHVLALHVLVSSSDADTGQQVPFYLQRTLGGAYSLRGFSRHRFRDDQLLLLQAEHRWDINAFAMGALFIDAGKAAARVRDLDLSDLARDYGFGLRLGSRAGVALRADLAFGSGEGPRLFVRFDNVF